MERCYSTISLQDLKKPTKRNLVKSNKSDGETKMVFQEYIPCHHGYEFKTKKLKTTSLHRSIHTLHFGSPEMVAPSTGSTKGEIISSQDDLWSSIQSNYTFLMADDLITECQETRKELCLPLPQLSSIPVAALTFNPHHVITYDEFIDKFNTLHDSLHTLAISTTDTSRIHDSQCDQLLSKCQHLKEDGAIIKLMNPDLKDDVNRRCNILINKFEILKDKLYPKRKRERDVLIQNFASQMKDLRKWLKEVDGRLRKLNFNSDCATEKMNEVYGEEKALQREIESRGKELTTLVRQCESVEGASVDDLKRLRQAAAHLERSWHNIWIRSLEKQCLTEERLLQRQVDNNHRDVSDLEADEAPITKHRRLTLDRWSSVSSPSRMDKLKTETTARSNGPLSTKDVGVDCNEMVPVNDKCIMVGTTGIAALKAEYGDDFTNFEIIQDVGYSSESSTHLSSDDGGGTGRYFNIRVYNYNNVVNKTRCLSLKEELEMYDSLQPPSLASSVGSSFGGTSFNDSGLGASDTAVVTSTVFENVDVVERVFEDDVVERVLEECGGSSESDARDGVVAEEEEELDFDLSGLDSDDSKKDFHSRSSFTASAQVFYKMILVDSDNGEADTDDIDNAHSENDASTKSDTHAESFSKTLTESLLVSEENSPDKDESHQDCESESPADSIDCDTSHLLSSTPMQHYLRDGLHLDFLNSFQPLNLKRKRDCDSTDTTATGVWMNGGRMPSRIRSWLKRCSSGNECSNPRTRRTLFQRYVTADSCDASGEYTSSSADEGNPLSHEDSVSHRLDSCSVEGSLETVVRGLHRRSTARKESSPPMLPPPFSRSCAAKSGKCKSSQGPCKGGSYPCRSCGDLRWIKSSSVGDVRDGARESKEYLNKLLTKHSLSTSMPNVLPYHSDCCTENSKHSSSKSGRSDHPSHHRHSLTSVVSRNLSSSLDLEKKKKRRSRKKSSSSNRSSKSTLNNFDSSRQRSRTSINSLSTCGSRRQFSQRSSVCFEDSGTDFPSVDALSFEVKMVAENNIGHMSLKDELALALEDDMNAYVDSEALLSPVDSDVVLTQLEEQSTVSDQVWDGYQDMPYLSEAYSEATVDEDAVRKLTEFGDDYGSAIGPTVIESNRSKCDVPKSPKKTLHVKRMPAFHNDSDSESEDLQHLIEEAQKALYVTRSTLTRRQSNDFLTSTEYAELLATCGAHLHYLQTVKEQIEIDGKEHTFSSNDLKQLHALIDEWDFLREAAEMSKDKYLKAQTNIDALFTRMDSIPSSSNFELKKMKSWDVLEKSIAKLQMILLTLQETRDQLLEVNLEVHRFMTQYGGDENYRTCSLKESVTELYGRWDDAYEQNRTQLTELETINHRWQAFDKQLKSLHLKVKESISEEPCDTTDAQSSDLRVELDAAKRNFEYLRSVLIGGIDWEIIDLQLESLELQMEKHSLISPIIFSGDPLNPSLAEDVPDDHTEGAVKQIEQPISAQKSPNPHSKKVSKKDARFSKKKFSRFWRIIRVAVPVQLTLVLLFCLACYYEPNCCDRLNNFKFSFTPHLRYLRGPPPV